MSQSNTVSVTLAQAQWIDIQTLLERGRDDLSHYLDGYAEKDGYSAEDLAAANRLLQGDAADALAKQMEERNKPPVAEEEEQILYLANHGARCPVCRSDDISADFCRESEDDGSMTDDVKCASCGSEWTDRFVLESCQIHHRSETHKAMFLQTSGEYGLVEIGKACLPKDADVLDQDEFLTRIRTSPDDDIIYGAVSATLGRSLLQEFWREEGGHADAVSPQK